MKSWKFILSFFVIFFCSTLSASAQISLDQFTTVRDPLSLSVSPANPQPNQTTYAQVQSNQVQINSSRISWTINGVSQPSYADKPSLQFKASGSGSTQVIEVKVTTVDNQVYTKSITISPASVDLIWEANSSVPPFYKGKPLLAYQGSATIVAIPAFSSNGSVTNPKNLIYSWKSNDESIRGASGLGKDSLIYQLNGIVMRPVTISVTATTQDGKTAGTASITIRPRNPSILFYQNNPNYGMLYNTVLPSTFSLSDKQIVIRAYPFNFMGKSNTSDILTYAWSINGSTVTTQSTGAQQLQVQKPDVSGSSEVSVKVSDSSRIMQYSTARLMVNY